MATATATKNAPAKSTAAPAPFDFSALQPEKVDAPRRTTSNSVPLEQNPAVQWLQASWESKQEQSRTKDNATGAERITYIGSGQAVTVPKDQARALEKLIRDAAKGLKLGVTTRLTELSGNRIKLAFAAKTPKQPYTRKPKASAAK